MVAAFTTAASWSWINASSTRTWPVWLRCPGIRVARVVVFVAAADLADADIVVGEGRQIVFVEPGEARTRELTESATIALPAFLDSALYASMAP